MSRVVGTLECPSCNGKEFIAGPRGGAARNINCAGCGYWMNVCIIPRTIPGTDTIVAGGYWVIEEAEFKKLEVGNEPRNGRENSSGSR